METSPITQNNAILLPNQGKNSEIRRISKLSRYRGSKNLRKYESRVGYKARESDPYRPLKPYRRPYVNPRQVRRLGKYEIQRQKRRGGGGYGSRLRNFKWPQEYQRLGSEPKYKRRPKENMSSPPNRQPIRYSKVNFKPEQNTEQMMEEIEKKLDNRLSERLLEKFGAELEELTRRFEDSGKSTEQRLEPKQEVEIAEHAPEIPEESKDDLPLEGSFKVSRTFGLAVPIETDEEERVEAENKEERVETETKDEAIEKEETESEVTGIEGLDDVEVEGSSKDGTEQTEETATEELENIEVEGQAEPRETSETVPEEVIEQEEVVPELLPEESELYPIETEPHEAEVI